MRTQASHAVDADAPPHARWEPLDTNVTLVVVILGFVAGLIALLMGALAASDRYLPRGIFARRAPVIATTLPMRKPPREPRLQTSPSRDYATWLRAQRELLSTYGVSPEGDLRIPIEEAMPLVAKQLEEERTR